MGGMAGMGGMSPMGGMGGPSISPHHMGMGGLSPMGGGPNGPNPRAMQGSPMGGPGQNSPMNSLPMGSPMGNPIGSPLGPPSGPGPGNPGNPGGPQQQQQPPQPPMNNGQMGPPPLHSPLGNIRPVGTVLQISRHLNAPVGDKRHYAGMRVANHRNKLT